MYFQPVHNLHFCEEPPATLKREKKGSKIESKCFNGPDSIRNQVLDKNWAVILNMNTYDWGSISLKDGILW